MTKLMKRESTGKDGKVYVSYKIGKLNEFGTGLAIDQKLTGELAFEPKIKRNITYYDKTAKMNKTFDACSIVLKGGNLNSFEIDLHEEYNNATFDVPSSLVDRMEGLMAETTISIFLKPFTDKTGKEKAMWEVETSLPEVEVHEDESSISSFEVKPEIVKKVKEALKNGEVTLEQEVEVKLTNDDTLSLPVRDII